MTKRITFLSMIAAILLMAGCTKETTKTIKATISDYNRDKSEKVYIDDAKFSCWNAGDKIALCYGTETAEGTVSELSDDHRTGHINIPGGATAPFYAVYPQSAVSSISSTSATVTFKSMQIYKEDANGNQIVEAPMAASTQTGSRLDFHNISSLLKVLVPAGTNVTDIYVTTTGTNRPVLWGTGSVTFPDYNNNNTGETAPTLSSLTANANAPDGGKTIYLHINEGSTPTTTTVSMGESNVQADVYYIVLPPVTTRTNFKVTVNYKTTEEVTTTIGETTTSTTINHFYKNILEQTNGTSTLLANTIGTVSFLNKNFDPEPHNPDIDEHLPGTFSVSPTLKVNFSKGNLNYLVTDPASNDGETYIWKYNNYQDENIGYNVSVEGGVPVVGGTSNYSRICLLQNGVVVVPHDNSSLNGSFYDWGNFIDRNTTDNHWFTLSPYEWHYLLNVRPVAYKRYDHVTINGYQGLLLYPDEFLWPDPNISENNNYSGNNWTALENAGCVFLIAGGYYDHANPPTQHNSAQGYYWARLDGQDPAYSNVSAGVNILANQIANFLHFTSSSVETHVANNARVQAGHALMVRLVHRAD